ncbi:hypothetical protein, partial [Aestuariivirga sp.]|uniref:hypothetical protein n=1 Tax=Aestuariivirga sp. TaxID=2650926 RepID=UPI003019DE94
MIRPLIALALLTTVATTAAQACANFSVYKEEGHTYCSLALFGPDSLEIFTDEGDGGISDGLTRG